MEIEEITDKLKQGKIGILPTDTIYGLVGVIRPEVVEEIYRIKERDPKKPSIILIGTLSDLLNFDIKLNKVELEELMKFWPGRVSIILKCPGEKFKFLHRGTGSIAFRLPDSVFLERILSKTGPLVAPSANPEAKPPATTIEEAKRYFGKKVDFYYDGGRIVSQPSKLIQIIDGKVITLR